MAVTSTFTEPTVPGRGSLIQVKWVFDLGAGDIITGNKPTARKFNGYFLGAYYTASQGTTLTLTISVHGVDLLDGLATSLGTTSKWLPAITDIATVNTQAQNGLPFFDNLTFAITASANNDAGTVFAYIRLPGT